MAKYLLKFAILASLTVTLVGCGGGDGDNTTTGNGGVAAKPDTPNMQATPEETFKNFKAAMVKDDWGEALQYLTSDSQDILVGMMVFGTTMGVAFNPDEEKQKSLQESLDKLLKEHGVKTEEDESEGPPAGGMEAAMKEMVAGVKDKGACLNAIMEWSKKNLDSKQGGSPQICLWQLRSTK